MVVGAACLLRPGSVLRLGSQTPLDWRQTAMPEVSVVIVNWNTKDLTAACIASVLQTAGNLEVEIVVVDNASTDGSTSLLAKQFPCVKLICNQSNVGFARSNNPGAAASQGRYILFLNSDARLRPN